MTGGDALLTIAEMAIGLAGFSAVVAAFAQRGELNATDRSRFVWLFSTAFVAALLAFVPILLSEASLEGGTLWRVASTIMIVVWVTQIGLVLYGQFQDRGDPDASLREFSTGPLLFVPSCMNLALQVANVSGLVWEPSSAAYIVGALVWLYAAALIFMAIVLNRYAT